MELNAQLIAFVYAINAHNVLTTEQMQQVIERTADVDDFCDGNMVLAQAFVDLKYIKDIEDDLDTLNTDSYLNAWNEAYAIAVNAKFFPWEFKCFWSKEAFDKNETRKETVKFFSANNCYGPDEWERLYKLNVGETATTPDYGDYHTIKRTK